MLDLARLFEENKVTGISNDSRNIARGDVFFAVKGEKFDGNSYIDEALLKGASLVITDDCGREKLPKIVYTPAIRQVLAESASLIYPACPKQMVSATGTNGKTSVVSYCQQLWALLGKRSASMGTLGVLCSEKPAQNCFADDKYSATTTLDTVTFRQALNTLAGQQVEYVAFESSSHGLAQQRLYGIKVVAAGFTSFSRDHLDYHGDMWAYLQAKLRLFSENLVSGGLAVINSEIHEIEQIKEFLATCSVEVVTVGKGGDVEIKVASSSLAGQEIQFSYRGKNYRFYTDILGSFQASNIIIAALMVEKSGFDFDEIAGHLSDIKGVVGRLQRVTGPDYPFQIFVDYAHTPDSLEKSLGELSHLKEQGSRLLVVFGCGGNRDKGKRPEMGRIAARLADVVIITDDNPRLEDPALIRREIMEAAAPATEIGDRKEAIYHAIQSMKKGDILLIAGKGHEDYQIVGAEIHSFSDVEVALEALK